jgi:hypothetical protein
MEFFVRKVVAVDQQKDGVATDRQYIQNSVLSNSKNLKWEWKSVNDFDRLEKFSDDEVFEDEIVFKLV